MHVREDELDFDNVSSRPATGLSGLEIPRDRPAVGSRRGWRSVGIEVSACPDVEVPWDPRVVRAIHNEWDPQILPLVVRRAYRATTGELRIARFHALGRYHPDPEFKAAPWTQRVMMPLRGRKKRPQVMLFHHEDRRGRLGDGLPGSYLPFDWRVYKAVRSLYQEMSESQKLRYIDDVEKREKAALVKAADERTDQRWKEDGEWLRRAWASVTKEDIGNHLTSVTQRKPMVGLGRAS
jgi:hypothetical protein